MNGTTIDYVGTELELFAEAKNWKSYLRRTLVPHIRGNVAEVGAGIGATTKALGNHDAVTGWTCVEPDTPQFDRLRESLSQEDYGHPLLFHGGTLADLPPEPIYDTILYIDVLEHIDDDRREIGIAIERLKTGGKIIVLCPAWQFLFSPFDKAVGHYRRHTKASLRATAQPGMTEVSAFYLDSVGFFASLCNKALLRQSMPTKGQIGLWDSAMVPVSRWTDTILARVIGKSVVLIWTKD